MEREGTNLIEINNLIARTNEEYIHFCDFDYKNQINRCSIENVPTWVNNTVKIVWKTLWLKDIIPQEPIQKKIIEVQNQDNNDTNNNNHNINNNNNNNNYINNNINNNNNHDDGNINNIDDNNNNINNNEQIS